MGPSHQSADSRQKFVEFKGLDQIIISTRVEPLHTVCRSVARGQHQHRRRGPFAPRPLNDVGTRKAGHAPIDDRSGVLVDAQKAKCLVTATSHVNDVARPAKPAREDVGEWAVIFSYENSHRSISAFMDAGGRKRDSGGIAQRVPARTYGPLTGPFVPGFWNDLGGPESSAFCKHAMSRIKAMFSTSVARLPRESARRVRTVPPRAPEIRTNGRLTA